jgi:PhnB protein
MVNWKPDSWKSTLAPYLICKDATKAIEFYKKAFNAQEVDRMEAGGKIMHAELKIGEAIIMLADEFPEMGNVSPQTLKGSPVSIFMYVQDVDKWFEQATKAGATVERAPQDMFWGDRYGHLNDPFGHKWAFATHKEDVSPEEMEKRAAEFNKQMAGAHK